MNDNMRKIAWMYAFIQVVKNSTAETWHELPERAESILDALQKDPMKWDE